MPQSPAPSSRQPTGHLSAVLCGRNHLLLPDGSAAPRQSRYRKGGVGKDARWAGIPVFQNPLYCSLCQLLPPPEDQGGSLVSVDEEGTSLDL